jgi:hypothetical protein
MADPDELLAVGMGRAGKRGRGQKRAERQGLQNLLHM